MKRLFLSAPTTCALLLGAGLLLRANAALRTEASPSGDPTVRVLKEGPRAAPMDVTPHLGRGRQAAAGKATPGEWREQKSSHRGNGKSPRARRARARKRSPERVAVERR